MPSKTYFGYLLKQRVNSETIPFFVFNARAKDLQEWAGIRRVPDYAGGTQRTFRESRARAITRFLKSDAVNTIPNSVLIAFQPGTTEFTPITEQIDECLPEDLDILNGCDNQAQWGTLKFSYTSGLPENDRIAMIVDGQHRLNGMYEFEDENLPVIVISLVNAPLKEQAFQFIVINNKAVRVAAESAKSIVAELDEPDETELGDRLLKAGIKYKDVSPILREINDLQNSPFYMLLDWSYNRSGTKLVQLTAVEQSLKYLKTLFTFLEDDEDSLLEIFLAISQGVKNTFPSLWGRDNVFMKKVSLNALNEFVCERLKMAWEFGLFDIFDPERVTQQTEQILSSVPSEFWEATWGIRIQDNANVRDLIKSDLAQITENRKLRKRWSEDLKLIASS